MRRLLLLLVLVVVPTACDVALEVATGTVTVPVVLAPPPVSLDVGALVSEVEQGICDATEPLAPDCRVLVELERAVTGDSSDPPRLPSEFPVVFDLPMPAGPPVAIDLEAFVERLGYFDGAHFKIGVPVDLAGALTEEHVAALAGVRFRSVELLFDENTLTFDLPPVRLYVVPSAVEEGADAAALIDEGEAALCGVFEGQRAEERAPLAFEPALGATETLNAALSARSFFAIVAVRDDAVLRLGSALREGWRRKPDGKVSLSLRIEADVAVYTGAAARVAAEQGAAASGEDER